MLALMLLIKKTICNVSISNMMMFKYYINVMYLFVIMGNYLKYYYLKYCSI